MIQGTTRLQGAGLGWAGKPDSGRGGKRGRHGLREQESMRTRKMGRNEALRETQRQREMGKYRVRSQKMSRD